MKLPLFLFLALSLVSCASFHSSPHPEEILPVIREFERDFRTRVSVPIFIEEIDPRFYGLCERQSDGYKKIRISNVAMATLNPAQVKMLVYHELGHCHLDLPHRSEMFPSGCPQSLMIPQMFTEQQTLNCFNQAPEYYVSELKMMSKSYQ